MFYIGLTAVYQNMRSESRGSLPKIYVLLHNIGASVSLAGHAISGTIGVCLEDVTISLNELHVHVDHPGNTVIEYYSGYVAALGGLVASTAGGWRASVEYAGRPFRHLFSWAFKPGRQRAGWL